MPINLNIKEEDKKFLLKLSKEINSQDKRGTSHVFFMVSDLVRIYGDSSWCEEKERVEEPHDNDLCESCLKKYNKGDELPDKCDDCYNEAFDWYNLERQIMNDHGVFFTAKACEDYIESRHYQFHKPKSYGLSAYWSEEFKQIQTIISKLTTEKELLK